jgi:hypothetical protein
MAMSNLINVKCELGGPHISGKIFIMSSNKKKENLGFSPAKIWKFSVAILINISKNHQISIND